MRLSTLFSYSSCIEQINSEMFVVPTSIQDSPVSGMTAGKAAII